MNKILLASVSALALAGLAAAPSLAQDAKVTIIKPDGTQVEQNATSAAEAVENAAEATGEAARDAAEATGEAARDAAEATGEAARDAAEATGEAVEDAAAATADAAGDAVRATRSAAETAGEKIEDAADATTTAARDAAETTERAVERTVVTVDRGVAEFDPAMIETTVPAGSYLSTALLNEAVQTPDGENIASTASFVITPDGQITHIVVAFGGFLGLGEKRVLLPWNAFSIHPDGEVLTVNLTEEQIEAMPAFEPSATAAN